MAACCSSSSQSVGDPPKIDSQMKNKLMKVLQQSVKKGGAKQSRQRRRGKDKEQNTSFPKSATRQTPCCKPQKQASCCPKKIPCAQKRNIKRNKTPCISECSPQAPQRSSCPKVLKKNSSRNYQWVREKLPVSLKASTSENGCSKSQQKGNGCSQKTSKKFKPPNLCGTKSPSVKTGERRSCPKIASPCQDTCQADTIRKPLFPKPSVQAPCCPKPSTKKCKSSKDENLCVIVYSVSKPERKPSCPKVSLNSCEDPCRTNTERMPLFPKPTCKKPCGVKPPEEAKSCCPEIFTPKCASSKGENPCAPACTPACPKTSQNPCSKPPKNENPCCPKSSPPKCTPSKEKNPCPPVCSSAGSKPSQNACEETCQSNTERMPLFPKPACRSKPSKDESSCCPKSSPPKCKSSCPPKSLSAQSSQVSSITICLSDSSCSKSQKRKPKNTKNACCLPKTPPNLCPNICQSDTERMPLFPKPRTPRSPCCKPPKEENPCCPSPKKCTPEKDEVNLKCCSAKGDSVLPCPNTCPKACQSDTGRKPLFPKPSTSKTSSCTACPTYCKPTCPAQLLCPPPLNGPIQPPKKELDKASCKLKPLPCPPQKIKPKILSESMCPVKLGKVRDCKKSFIVSQVDNKCWNNKFLVSDCIEAETCCSRRRSVPCEPRYTVYHTTTCA